MKAKILVAPVLIISIAAMSGCGGSGDRPKTVPVSGAVAYNGKPVENATVSFMMEGAPRVATGVTDKEGKFQLSTFALNDGAVIGTHTITVTKTDPSAAAPVKAANKAGDPSDLASQMQEMAEEAGKFKGLLPEKYSTQSSTPLSETVSEGGPNEFVLQLTD